jgi:hypothetical protein
MPARVGQIPVREEGRDRRKRQRGHDRLFAGGFCVGAEDMDPNNHIGTPPLFQLQMGSHAMKKPANEGGSLIQVSRLSKLENDFA